jgi:hypothetical protein
MVATEVAGHVRQGYRSFLGSSVFSRAIETPGVAEVCDFLSQFHLLAITEYHGSM